MLLLKNVSRGGDGEGEKKTKKGFFLNPKKPLGGGDGGGGKNTKGKQEKVVSSTKVLMGIFLQIEN